MMEPFTDNESSELPEKHKTRLYPVVLELFSKKDFHKVSIREISKISGISTTTLYRYYPSKEKLLFSILDERLRELSSTIKLHIQGLESTKEMFRKLFWVTLNHYDKNPGLAVATFMTVPTRSWMQEETYHLKDAYKIIVEIINHGRNSDEIDSNISNEQIIDLYFMYCNRQIHRWCYHNNTSQLADSMGQFFDVFWKTVSAIS